MKGHISGLVLGVLGGWGSSAAGSSAQGGMAAAGLSSTAEFTSAAPTCWISEEADVYLGNTSLQNELINSFMCLSDVIQVLLYGAGEGGILMFR